MVRVGLIGFGLAGQAFHAPVIRGVKGMELCCILERHGSRAREMYPDVRVARTLEELLADKEIRLCVVATPNDSHGELARACLEAGRDVVVDKPFAPTLAQCEEVARLAVKQGRLLTCITTGDGTEIFRRCRGSWNRGLWAPSPSMKRASIGSIWRGQRVLGGSAPISRRRACCSIWGHI